MKMSRNSLLFRWAYLFDKKPLHQTDVCSVFWRAALLSPIKCLFLLACSGLALSGMCLLFYRFWETIAWIVGTICLGLALSYLAIRARKGIGARAGSARHSLSSSLIAHRIRDLKNKTCTIIELE